MKVISIKEILNKLKSGELIKDFKFFEPNFLIFRTRNGKWKIIEIEDGLFFYRKNKGWSVTKKSKKKKRKKK